MRGAQTVDWREVQRGERTFVEISKIEFLVRVGFIGSTAHERAIVFQGGPMKVMSVSSFGQVWPNAYVTQLIRPNFGSVKVPSKSNKTPGISVPVFCLRCQHPIGTEPVSEAAFWLEGNAVEDAFCKRLRKISH